MPEYGNIDPSFPGLKHGLDSRVESKRVADAAGLNFGYPVFGYVGNEKDVFTYKQDQSQTVFDADFVTLNNIVATVNGVAVTAVVFDTDHDTTMTNLKEQILADIPGATVTLTDVAGDNRTIVIQIDGVNVVVTWAVTLGASQAGDTVTVSSTMVFKGISMYTALEAAVKKDLAGNVLEGGALYPYKDAANIMIDGWIDGVIAVDVSANTAAYVVASGANQGKLTNVAGVALTGVTFEKSNTAAVGYATVRINK